MKVIIVDKVNDYLQNNLELNGIEVANYSLTKADEILKILPDYDGIVIRSKFKLDASVLSGLPKLKFIARVGAGMESIDVDFVESKGIAVFNAPEGNRNAVGEHTLGLILALFNKICIANAEVKNGKWQREPNRGLELEGKTIGIIGYGNMGKAFAKVLSGFDVEVIAYDKYKKNFADEFVEEVDLQGIFERTDILSLHVPLQDDTFYMFDKNFISQFAKPFYLVNTARGKVVKTVDLIDALRKGKISGAALDVLEFEKISFETLAAEKNDIVESLKSFDNVLITPHIAGLTKESDLKLAKVIFEKIISFVEKL